ncbi:hypothetical protein [Streptomyces griseoruber]|uniref:hypothetical protein n=1 Tax=Streptomyces griseoruber TaxID=1943 RepID=UPI000A950FCC|nr:hypothetical protein [Streptomyces griseoruber]
MPVFPPPNQLHAEDIEPHAEIVTENFLAIPHLVAGTGRIGLMPERVSAPAPSAQPITVVQPAFEIGHLMESLWWHTSMDANRPTCGCAASPPGQAKQSRAVPWFKSATSC